MTRLNISRFAGVWVFLLCAVGLVSSARTETENTPPDGQIPEENVDASQLDPTAQLKALGEWQGSLMFTAQELQKLRDAAEFSKNPSATGDARETGATAAAAAAAAGQSTPSTPPPLPNYFLTSIVFVSPDDWTFWLNDKRMRAGEKMTGLKVEKITPEYVDLIWEPTSLESMLPEWKARLAESERLSAQPVRVTPNGSEVRFRIEPHQTFVGSKLLVQEGRYVPLPVTPTSEDGDDVRQSDASGPLSKRLDKTRGKAPQPPTSAVRDPRDIADRLMNQYKKLDTLIPMQQEP